jgi:amidase
MEAQAKSSVETPFDPLTITSLGLQALLQKGTLTSTELVDVYLKAIEKNNDKLHAVLHTISPELLRTRISELDAERASGHVRGPLHGIPVLIKVSK